MKVTVVIPVHNAARTLERAVRSVQQQTYTNWELILVDNNSTDATPALIRRLQKTDPHGRIQRLDESRPGAPYARNTGLAHARGEWVQFLDDDDELLPKKFSQQLALIRTNTPDWIIGSYRTTSPDHPTATTIAGGRPLRDLQVGHTIANLYRRAALLEAGGWRQGLPDNQDVELNLRLLASGYPFAVSQDITAIYHRRGQASNSVSVRDPLGAAQRQVTLHAQLLSRLIVRQPEAYAANATYLTGRLLATIRQLATLDLNEAAGAYAAYFGTPAEGWTHTRFPPHNPRYVVLYSWLGFRRTEWLRRGVARLLPPKLKRVLKG